MFTLWMCRIKASPLWRENSILIANILILMLIPDPLILMLISITRFIITTLSYSTWFLKLWREHKIYLTNQCHFLISKLIQGKTFIANKIHCWTACLIMFLLYKICKFSHHLIIGAWITDHGSSEHSFFDDRVEVVEPPKGIL